MKTMMTLTTMELLHTESTFQGCKDYIDIAWPFSARVT